MDGVIFGFPLIDVDNIPIMHHAGLILKWDDEDPWNSVVAHYGIGSQGKVTLHTMEDAAKLADGDRILINPYFKAEFYDYPYYIEEEDGQYFLAPGEELIEYEMNHSKYNIWTSNCQHFVQHFIPEPLALESDIHPVLPSLVSNILNGAIHGEKISIIMNDTIHDYSMLRSNGICMWDRSMDMIISK